MQGATAEKIYASMGKTPEQMGATGNLGVRDKAWKTQNHIQKRLQILFEIKIYIKFDAFQISRLR